MAEIDTIPAATPESVVEPVADPDPSLSNPFAEQITALAGRTSLNDDNIIRFIESGWTVDQIAQYYPPDGST